MSLVVGGALGLTGSTAWEQRNRRGLRRSCLIGPIYLVGNGKTDPGAEPGNQAVSESPELGNQSACLKVGVGVFGSRHLAASRCCC